MQPSTSSGRKAPLALLPFSWGIAFATVAGVFKIVACVRGAGSRRYPQSAILGAILVSGQLCVGENLIMSTVLFLLLAWAIHANVAAVVVPFIVVLSPYPFRYRFTREVS
jgi:hypothetical protein